MKVPEGALKQEKIVSAADAARQLDIVADLLTIAGADPLLCHCYRRVAARLREVMSDTIGSGELENIILRMPGIGANIGAKILAVVRGERPNLLDAMGKMLPPALASLLLLPGLGPRRVNLLYNELGIESIEQLELAAAAGKLRALPGFGPALEQRLLVTIAHRKKSVAERYCMLDDGAAAANTRRAGLAS